MAIQQSKEARQAVPGTESAGRVADVLLLFTHGPDSLGVSGVARQTELSKAVVHRILRTLVDRGLLLHDGVTRTYALGPAAAALGARALRESRLRTAAMPHLRQLHAATGETTTVSGIVPFGRVYLDQVESTREIKMTVEVGRRFPLHAGSSSNCILAFLPAIEQERLIAAPLERLTDQTITDANSLRAILSEIRATGFAQSDGARQDGAGSVAAPVFGFDGSVVGAISVCGPAGRVHAEARARFVPLLRAAADAISQELGWRGGLPDDAWSAPA